MKKKKQITQVLAAVYSWAVTGLFAGLATAAIHEPSMLTFIGLLVGSGFMLPVKFFYGNFDNLYEKMRSQIIEERYTVAFTSVLFLLSYFSFTQGLVFPGSGVLNLSFHASAQIFMPVQNLFYSVSGEFLGPLSFNLGRWLLQLMYLYLVIGLIVDMTHKTVDLSVTEAFREKINRSISRLSQ